MSEQHLSKRSRIEAPAEQVFAWHERAGAFERLVPPWEEVKVLERRGTIRDGDRLTFQVNYTGVPITCVAEHRDYEPGRQFRDVQVKGPFARWEHLHRVEPIDAGACELIDELHYELPAGGLGRALAGGALEQRLGRMFDYRHRVIARDLAAHRSYFPDRSLTIAITGASGLIGSALVPLLTSGGHRVKRFVRRAAEGEDEIAWSPAEQRLEAEKLRDVDAVVNLAGENIFGRWTRAKKAAIRDSRVLGTRTMADALGSLDAGPRTLINASAMGYYGDRGDELLDEDAEAGSGFLAETCVAWEQASFPARSAGVRTVLCRFGLVLTPRGGALGNMLPAFRLGGGGPLGGGQAWWSWIHIEDLIHAIYHALATEELKGPANWCGPSPVTNADFTRTLGRVLHRPALLRVPRFAARLALGELADEGLFASVRMTPRRLEESGFAFAFTELEPALRDLLGK